MLWLNGDGLRVGYGLFIFCRLGAPRQAESEKDRKNQIFHRKIFGKAECENEQLRG